jgi:hypothetical protein
LAEGSAVLRCVGRGTPRLARITKQEVQPDRDQPDGDVTALDEEVDLIEWMVETADAFVRVFPRYL